MKNFKLLSASILMATAACAVSAEPSTPDAQKGASTVVPPAAALSDSRTLITRVDVSPTHFVQFFADANGALMMVEGAKIGEPSVLAPEDDRCVVSLYRYLRPGEAVPSALVEAEARALAQLGKVRPKMTPPPEVQGSRWASVSCGRARLSRGRPATTAGSRQTHARAN